MPHVNLWYVTDVTMEGEAKVAGDMWQPPHLAPLQSPQHRSHAYPEIPSNAGTLIPGGAHRDDRPPQAADGLLSDASDCPLDGAAYLEGSVAQNIVLSV
jgi:hypothetical protein